MTAAQTAPLSPENLLPLSDSELALLAQTQGLGIALDQASQDQTLSTQADQALTQIFTLGKTIKMYHKCFKLI